MAFVSYPFPSLSWEYQGLDYAGIPNMTQAIANQMYSDGVRFVGRYLFSPQYPNGKGLSAAEAEFYLNAGIKIFLYYELASTDAISGYDRGVELGDIANSEAEAINVPPGTPIYCCCDMGVTDAQANGVVMQYLQGFASQLPDYNVGIYGGANVMQACYNLNPDYYRVQAGAWGNQEWSELNVRQWLIGTNRQAEADGYIKIDNIVLDNQGYATWRGYAVDLCSAPNLNNMWGGSQPPPSDRTGMPIWMYLRLFNKE